MHKDRSLDTLKATDVSPCSISAPLHCREVTPNRADCMQFESWPWHKWHDLDNKRVLRCCQKVAQPSLHIQCMLWNTWTAMDGFRCNTGSHFTCWEGTQNLVFWVHCHSQPWLKLQGVIHEWLTKAFRSFSHLPYTPDEGYETIQQQ